ALSWVIDYGEEEVENVMGKKYNFAKIDAEKWDNTYKAALTEQEARWSDLKDLDQPRSKEQLDEDATLILEAMSRATAEAVPELRPS
ncbi:hypothetical protein R3P38DRAFT_2416516, partial [Favolaschia claudopus]